MKLNNILKPVAVLSASAVLVSAAGCADTSWSFKTSNKTLTNGGWIYYTYTAANEAMQKIEEDTEKSVDLATDDLTSKKVEKKNAVDWINSEAKKNAVAQLTVEKLVKDNKVKLDNDYIDSTKKQYISYIEQYGTDFYNTLGVSTETIADISIVYPYKSEQLFKHIYDKDGTKEVSDKEVKKYFTDNYTDYYYIPYSFKTTDEEGNSTDIDDETKDKVTAAFAKYVKELNSGDKTPSDIDEEYKTDFEVETSAGVSDTVNFEDSTMNEDLQKAIKALKEKKAAVKEIDDTYYLIYKGSISEKAEKISDDESDDDAVSRIDLVHAIKDDEYQKYLEAEQKKLKYETNDDCLSKYTVERTINILADQAKSQSSDS